MTEQLTFTQAYMTWTKEANAIEDRLADIWRELREGVVTVDLEHVSSRLQEVERQLRSAKLAFEEWEVLFREKLLVERGLWQVAAGSTDRPSDLTEEAPESAGAAAYGTVTGFRFQTAAWISTMLSIFYLLWQYRWVYAALFGKQKTQKRPATG